MLRQDPDVILIGEMRDEETVRTALSAAETGHLVLSTLHTIDAVETVNRIVDFFPPHQHQQVRAMLAGTLKGVISQRLVPTIDHSGRVAACEVLTMTGRVRDMIMDPNETGKLGEVIARGRLLRDADLRPVALQPLPGGHDLARAGAEAATHPHDFKLLVASEGQRSTSVAQLYGDDDESRAGDRNEQSLRSTPQPRQPAASPAADERPRAQPAQSPSPAQAGTAAPRSSSARAQAGPDAAAGAPPRASACGGTAARRPVPTPPEQADGGRIGACRSLGLRAATVPNFTL